MLQFTAWVDAVIFVFSLNNELSYNTVASYFNKMSHYRNSAEIPIILVGTQGDFIYFHLPQICLWKSPIMNLSGRFAPVLLAIAIYGTLAVFFNNIYYIIATVKEFLKCSLDSRKISRIKNNLCHFRRPSTSSAENPKDKQAHFHI